MTILEKFLNDELSEDTRMELDYQSFAAKSEATNRVATLYEFSIELEDDSYTLRVLHYEDTDEINFASVDKLMKISDDENALPAYTDLLPFVEMDIDVFKQKVCETAREIIENL